MKRYLFSAILCFFAAQFTSAQICTPDPQYTNTNTQRGIYPDSATNFADAYVGTPYTQTVTVVVPQDTVYNSIPVSLDSIHVVSMNGLPSGFVYGCWNLTNCTYKGNTIGCAKIYGTCSNIADTGTHWLTIPIKIYVGGSPFPLNKTITQYRIKVHAPQAVANVNDVIFGVAQNYPNPFNDQTEIKYSSPDACNMKLMIFNILGEKIMCVSLKAQRGMNKIDLRSAWFAPGTYLYTLDNGEAKITRRMVVTR